MQILLLAGIAALIGLARTPAYDANIRSLVQVERDFDRAVADRGADVGFLEHLADDGIIFRPGPVPGRAWFSGHPSAKPAKSRLTWRPARADVSFAGDLGYTTGPWKILPVAGGAPLATGHYVTLWRRSGKGPWKIVLDCGTSCPIPESDPADVVTPAAIRALAAKWNRTPVDAVPLAAALRAADSATMLVWGKDKPSSALAAHGAGTLMLFRSGVEPVEGLGRGANAADTLSGNMVSWSQGGVAVASSGDIGYTYGTITAKPAEGDAETSGYLRIWRITPSGFWEIVLDLL
ncbi:MAG TPA: nuclear transport factor 2 family protein [Candidatus Kapabacteria bacterium]|nr:nuclear transport factor 2 family protein [Candidatus Kapabacteria bacterium]